MFAILAAVITSTETVSIESEIQKLTPSAVVELFEIDLTPWGDSKYYFHAGTNELRQAVVWQGNTYTPWPVQASGFAYNSEGTLARPKVTIANVNGMITAMCIAFGDMLGAKVTRRTTMAKFLDAANFQGGNDTADPESHFPDEIYYIDQKTREDVDVEFTLTAAFDVEGVKLPRGQVIKDVCPWRYRGTECGYAGTAYFKADDTSTTQEALDVCGKRLSSCKCRFGANAELPFGGFPGVGYTS